VFLPGFPLSRQDRKKEGKSLKHLETRKVGPVAHSSPRLEELRKREKGASSSPKQRKKGKKKESLAGPAWTALPSPKKGRLFLLSS